MKQIKRLEGRHNSALDEVFHQLNLWNVGNVIYWMKFFEMIGNVPGDVVECGIGRGRSLIILSAINELLDPSEGGARKIYGYDSFAGFPEPTAEDDSSRMPQRGDWAWSPSGKYEYSPKFLREVLKQAGVDSSNIVMTPGFFDESLLHHPDRPIALLHVDGDLYRSYMSCLELLYPKVASGGVVVFDDFMAEESTNEKFPGARRAVKEFFGAEYAKLRVSVGGNYYYVKP